MNQPDTPEPRTPNLADRKIPRLLRRPAAWLAVLALLMMGLALGTRAQLEEFRRDIARRLADGDTIAKESRAIARQNQEVLAALQAKVGALESRLAEAQSQQVALETMYQELSKSRDDRLLSEIEQSLSIAAQQLQLAGNVEAALIALQEADNRLARSSQPQLLGLRKLIARDIARLRALPSADVSGAALKLEAVIGSIDALPFAFEHRPRTRPEHRQAADKDAARQGFARPLIDDIWKELRQLVRIQRVDQVDPGLLAPDQALFLRENLKLRLVNARLSLLARDTRSFREDLNQARGWLEKYFDVQSRPVQLATSTLKGLASFDAAQELPTLMETLNAVRGLRAQRGTN